MKTYKKIFFFMLFLFMSGTIMSQTYEEWLKQEQANFGKFKLEQEKMLQAMRDDYASYVKHRDREYSDYLRKEWESFRVFSGKKPPEKPKPTALPEFKPVPGTPVNPIAIRTTLVDVPKSIPSLLKMPVIQKPEPVGIPEDALSFSFCGAKVYLDVDRNIGNISTGKKGKPAVTDFWDKASGTSYNSLINQLMAAKSQFSVNDYGYFMLIQAAAATIYPTDDQQDQRLLLAWFLMVRSGFDVRIAYNATQIAILLPSYNTLFSRQFLAINNLNYYFFSPFDGKDIMTYDKGYDPANSPVDFNIASPMNFGNKPVKKPMVFKFKDKTYNFEFAYDPGVIQFYKDYPQIGRAHV